MEKGTGFISQSEWGILVKAICIIGSPKRDESTVHVVDKMINGMVANKIEVKNRISFILG